MLKTNAVASSLSIGGLGNTINTSTSENKVAIDVKINFCDKNVRLISKPI